MDAQDYIVINSKIVTIAAIVAVSVLATGFIVSTARQQALADSETDFKLK